MPLLAPFNVWLSGGLTWRATMTTLFVVPIIAATFALSPAANLRNHHHHHLAQQQPLHQISRTMGIVGHTNFVVSRGNRRCSSIRSSATSSNGEILATRRLETLAQIANNALERHGANIFKPFHARVGVVSPIHGSSRGDDTDGDFQQRFLRLGLLATESYTRSGNIKDEYTVAAMPYYDTDGSGLCIAPQMATQLVYKDLLPEGYDGWTGDVGLLAMLLLNEMARSNACVGNRNKGIDLPKRKDGMQSLMSAWISTLPSPKEMETMHPLLWDEDDQEKLQSSSTKKIYRLLDDIDDDSSWLNERVWSVDRATFPESVAIRVGTGDSGEEVVEERPCFSSSGFRYAVSLVRSRSFFVDGALRLLPFLDFANHDDHDSLELKGGTLGTMLWGGSTKGVLLKSCKSFKEGEEIRISYGPKGPADYLLDHGFVPPMCRWGKGRGLGSAITSELSFEVDDSDRFRDDKLDILEYETYDLAPMEPIQTFDVTGGFGSTGEPDPAMIQFLRLVKLGGTDAFLLESIFRKDIWGFMSEPVSEQNERGAVIAVIDACQNALSDMLEDNPVGSGTRDKTASDELCFMVRESERQALTRTLVYMQQEATALDLKEYYQERRLKSLGLDSEWTPEDDMSFGATRVPGGADYDW
jgi:[ribulose-bisphosphate carboxylase]-lysine N-methyltransferase